MAELEFDPFIDEIARELKKPVEIDAHFDARVMSALDPVVVPISTRLPRHAPTRTSMSLYGLRLSGLAAAAAIGGVAVFGALQFSKEKPAVVAAAPVEMVPVADVAVDPMTIPQNVQFLFASPSSRSVSLVGQFNDWDPTATPMVYDEVHGAWTVTIPLLPGRHQYQFLVDGVEHVTDPTAPQVSSDFSSANSVRTVVPVR
jgi:hypothetical protein